MKCHFFGELNEIFGHRPIINETGIDSTLLPPDLNDETCDEASLTSIYLKRSLSSDTQHNPPPSSSPVFNSLIG
nr:PREDICTED: uncharacterized protein LOC100879135 isoform X2 [Megachile rotundata]